MKTITKKISTPFIIIIFLVPFMIMILFNITMNIYVDRTTKAELKNSVSSIEILVKQQLMDGALDRIQGDNPDSVDENLTALRDGLKLSKVSLLYNLKKMNIEFLLISSEGKVLFPKSFEDSFLTEKILNKAKIELSEAGEDVLVEFRVGAKKYFSTYQSLTDRPDAVQLLFISSKNSANGTIKIINLILLCITLIAVGVSSAIALIVSKSISKPITRLSQYAKRIGRNEFITLPEDRSSVEIHELTQSMNEMSERIKNYDHAQRSFLQNASHELRTPLMSIQGYAEGIAKGVFADTVKTAGIICEESRRLNTLVEELLTLSRIENNNYKSELIDLNLSNIIKEYVQRIDGYALREGKVIHLNVLSDTILTKIDETLLSQAFINIISNCIKFAEKKVLVSLFTDNNLAVVKISDDGNGIAEEDLPHIFERFYKGKKGDFGLGLSIAKSAVEFMGGSIIAYNDNGAVFEIQLPRLS